MNTKKLQIHSGFAVFFFLRYCLLRTFLRLRGNAVLRVFGNLGLGPSDRDDCYKQ